MDVNGHKSCETKPMYKEYHGGTKFTLRKDYNLFDITVPGSCHGPYINH